MVLLSKTAKRLVLAKTVAIALFLIISIFSLIPAPQDPGFTAEPKNTAALSQKKTGPSSGATPQPEAQTPSPPAQSPYKEKLADGQTFIANGKVYPLRKYEAFLSPNDPYGLQWWHTSTALPQAWDSIGSPDTTIAIIDTGFALNHEEFNGRWATNAGENGVAVQEGPSDLNCTALGFPVQASCNNIDDNYDGIVDNESGSATVQNPSFLNCTGRGLPLNKSCNRVDDDDNGYVDDARGWDFVYHDSNVQAGVIYPAGDGVGHGTSVSGVAAATGNNGVGIAGVNWGSKILPLQALDDNGDGNTLSVGRAIYYAADQGVDVINLSLGSIQEDPYLREAIHYAYSKGAIVVAASGNGGCNCIKYPARYPEVVAVGASTSTGTVASYSDYGDSLDLVAPGSNIRSASWTAGNGASAYATGVSGTSFSAPYISGLLAAGKAMLPEASWGQHIAAMLESSDRKTLSASSPRSNAFGYGYVHAGNYLSRLSSPLNEQMMYLFGARNDDLLETANVVECRPGKIPASPLYKIASNGSVYFTISELERHIAQTNGAAVSSSGYFCASLPGDTAGIMRVMNTAQELANLTGK